MVPEAAPAAAAFSVTGSGRSGGVCCDGSLFRRGGAARGECGLVSNSIFPGCPHEFSCWSMSMILFACVVRIRDGLPLSASSDFHLDPRFLECRKRLKILSSILTQYPERGTARERDLSIQ
ncbi:hypothetical protein E2320_001496 [Naja naja]|nr:hypothetical protein E2320_001496 [Naja naja]